MSCCWLYVCTHTTKYLTAMNDFCASPLLSCFSFRMDYYLAQLMTGKGKERIKRERMWTYYREKLDSWVESCRRA